MFNQLAERFDLIFKNLRGLGKITDSNIQQTSREIRRVLLDADVNFKVAKEFIDRVKDVVRISSQQHQNHIRRWFF